jgi:ribosomal protein L15
MGRLERGKWAGWRKRAARGQKIEKKRKKRVGSTGGFGPWPIYRIGNLLNFQNLLQNATKLNSNKI